VSGRRPIIAQDRNGAHLGPLPCLRREGAQVASFRCISTNRHDAPLIRGQPDNGHEADADDGDDGDLRFLTPPHTAVNSDLHLLLETRRSMTVLSPFPNGKDFPFSRRSDFLNFGPWMPLTKNAIRSEQKSWAIVRSANCSESNLGSEITITTILSADWGG